MEINDITENSFSNETVGIYFYTPLCGICKVSLQMMEILAETFCATRFVKVNLNMHKKMAMDYEVEQVPCLIILKNDIIIDKTYNFSSITKLYDKLKATIN